MPKLKTQSSIIIKETILSLLLVLAGIHTLRAQPIDKIVINNDIQLIHLTDSVFVHVTWHNSDIYGRFPSNGMLVIKKGQALMVDTPMDNETTERLALYLKDSMQVDLAKLIVGHYHDDCMGGLEYLQSKGIESIANSMTINKCKELNQPVPSTSFTDALIFDFNDEQIECRFFGGGHSFDNITVWLPAKKILFGGCLIKSIHSNELGNTKDAVVEDWDTTVKKVIDQYEDVETVIPGHGAVGGAELLTHTIKLVEEHKDK